MTGYKINLTLVGAFVVAAIASLVLVLALLSGRTGDRDRYYTLYGNVAGLKFGSQVFFEGYPVGQVENIEPVQQGGRTHFKVELSVEAGWQIPKDSVAQPVAPGVLAPQTIAIAAGKSAELLAPGGMITPAAGVDLFSTLSGAAGNFDEITDTGLLPLLQNLNRQVDSLGRLIDEDLRPVLKNTRSIADATAQRWPGIVANADTAAANVAQATERLNLLLSAERIARIDRLIGNVDATASSLRTTAEQVEKLAAGGGPDLLVALQELRYSMETVSRYAEPTAQTLDTTMRNLQEFSRLVRQNPGVLLNSDNQPDDPVPPMRGAGAAP